MTTSNFTLDSAQWLTSEHFAIKQGVSRQRACQVLARALENPNYHYRGAGLIVRKEDAGYFVLASSLPKKSVPVTLPVTTSVDFPFCDWITLHQDYLDGCPLLHDGYIIRYLSNDEKEHTTYRSIKFEGSWDKSIQVRSDGKRVSMSGNLGAFNRPDNVFNYSLSDFIKIANRVCTMLNLPQFTPGTVILTEGKPKTFSFSSQRRFASKIKLIRTALLMSPQYVNFSEHFDRSGNLVFTYQKRIWTGARVTRIDLTSNFMTGSYVDTKDYLYFLGTKRLLDADGSVNYFYEKGKGFYVYSKVYDKYSELLAHNKRLDPYLKHLADWMYDVGLFRFEASFKSRYLTQNGCQWLGDLLQMTKQDDLTQEFKTRLAQTLLEPVIPDRANDYCGLSSGALGTYTKWVQGSDPLNFLNTRRTFNRHRKELKEKCGLDIMRPCPERFKETVIDIKRKVVIQPVTTLPPGYYLPAVGKDK